ncbi:hypothetical protein, partial [Devosia sp.]|uniref:hypothetical protein n=1 Tax=Devosia sp. TaxID=1871048 RepID=UPI002F22733F
MRRLYFLLMTTTVLGLGAPVQSTQAADLTINQIAQRHSQVQHFVECLRWMISDPEMHAANCLPGQELPLASLSSLGEGSVHAIA